MQTTRRHVLGSVFGALMMSLAACHADSDAAPAPAASDGMVAASANTGRALGVATWRVRQVDGALVATGLDEQGATRSQIETRFGVAPSGAPTTEIRSTMQGPAVMVVTSSSDGTVIDQNDFPAHPDAMSALEHLHDDLDALRSSAGSADGPASLVMKTRALSPATENLIDIGKDPLLVCYKHVDPLYGRQSCAGLVTGAQTFCTDAAFLCVAKEILTIHCGDDTFDQCHWARNNLDDKCEYCPAK